MNDIIVMCPTVKRAAMEWRYFVDKYEHNISEANKYQRKVKLLNGHYVFFKGETEGQKATRSFRGEIISINNF